ncbi:nuclear transport factor 2 family protein [Curvivirga aplysinae]|uniref:nuclear transport factor 2 family protein n=1 Tax=Curvivirga aplysinae TaxID=2529852 RepID=UPI0012BD5B67|nr:nuclear transport factor 2 family protein [Curvivirga aplysinae]MTI09026.1 DUF4440 domain-containing protein [Curvivirga aplysinae]
MEQTPHKLDDRQKAALIFANEAFYVAFSNNDIEAMESLWAREFKVTCLHPGWEPLMGRNNVMASFRAVLPNSPAVIPYAPNAFGVGDMGYVICYEKIRDTYLLATNVFIMEEGQWRLTHHQAGPTEAHPTPLEEEGSVN